MRKRVTTPCGGGDLVTKSCPTLATPWTVACQAPLSMGFSRQEHWSGLPFPSPEKVSLQKKSYHPGSRQRQGSCIENFLPFSTVQKSLSSHME